MQVCNYEGSCVFVNWQAFFNLRKPLVVPTNSVARENVTLKWIDTSSKFGHGRFQTDAERRAWTGTLKRDAKAAAEN